MTFRFKNRPLNAGQKSTVFFDRYVLSDFQKNTGDLEVEAVLVPLCVMRQICDALRSDLDLCRQFPIPKESQRPFMSHGYAKKFDSWFMRFWVQMFKRRAILSACERMCGGALGGAPQFGEAE